MHFQHTNRKLSTKENLELLLMNSEPDKNVKQLDLDIYEERSTMSEFCIQRFVLH